MPRLRRSKRESSGSECPRCPKLEARIRDLERKVDELTRAAKRQSAPFSKGDPKSVAARPGRKSGVEYGKRSVRAAPERIDRIVDVRLSESCSCGSQVIVYERTASQIQIELPDPAPVATRFDIAMGRCTSCGRTVRGRDPGQTSEALGAAAIQIGPRAAALAVLINKELGVSHEKTAAIIQAATGLSMCRASVARINERTASVLEPTYDEIADTIAGAAVVSPDETGWRIGGKRAWLWDAVCSIATLYQVAEGRGVEQAKALLGEDFGGVLCRDGWAVYRCLEDARHQTCYAHLLRRCAEMIEGSRTRAQTIPRLLAGLLTDALTIRDQRDAGELTVRQLHARIRALERRRDKLLAIKTSNPANRRLLRHVASECDHLFTLLREEGVDATNYRAEQAIRPAVVARKVWGGNRTHHGAHVFEVLVSVVRTARQQGIDALQMIADRLRDPQWRVAPQLTLAPNGSPR